MIGAAIPLSAGNAVQLYITPPAGAAWWRVLRRAGATAFAGPDDPDAVRVADLATEQSLVDLAGLVNGTPYRYRAYYRTAADAWIDSGADVSATPAASYFDGGPDPQAVLRERIELGLAVEVARGALLPTSGRIPVVTAPFGAREGITFPVVSVHVDSVAPSARGIGEMLFPDEREADGDWTEHEGWLARVTMQVVAVSLNGDERNALRRAIARVIQANLPVFAAASMSEVTLSQRDSERLLEDNAPQYLTSATFECVVPAFVAAGVPDITSTDATAIPMERLIHAEA